MNQKGSTYNLEATQRLGTTFGEESIHRDITFFHSRRIAPELPAQPVRHHRVVIVGGGFGGFEVAKQLAGAPVDVTTIDQRKHHIFQPLLYQVATASLATSDIAWPIRSLFRRRSDVATVLARVTGINAGDGCVEIDDGRRVPYDTLILATGARHTYFGHDEWEAVAPGLKTLEDATRIRANILLAFERAEWKPDLEEQAALLTFVIVGAGPTGVELAGTIAELARDTLRKEFRNIDTRHARVILVEAGTRILPGFQEDLAAYAARSLEKLGVEISLRRVVSECSSRGVVCGSEHLAARTIIWAAGVRASEAAEWLGAPHDRAGRLKVLEDLTVPGLPEIFAVGDTMTIADANGEQIPGTAPAAKQAGQHVAKAIIARLKRDTRVRPFRYRHLGSLAQIGKRRAIVDFRWIKLCRPAAWWLWGIAHIYFLIGMKNRLSIAISWLWIHTWNQRTARLITQYHAFEKQSRLQDARNDRP